MNKRVNFFNVKLSLFLSLFIFSSQVSYSYDLTSRQVPTVSSSSIQSDELAQLFSSNTPAETLHSYLVSKTVHADERAAISDWALQSMKDRKSEILNEWNLSQKHIIVVGAGIHSTIYLSNLIQRNPRIADSVLVLEAGEVVSANYGLGQPFRINSGKPTFLPVDARPNLFPGAILSPEETQYNEISNCFPNGKILSETATISLRAQNVDVLFSEKVSQIFEGSRTRYVVETTTGHSFTADEIIFATGISVPKANIPGLVEYMQHEKNKLSRNSSYVPRVELYTDFLARIGQQSPDSFRVYDNKVIGILGAQHGGNITAETFLGKLPEMGYKKYPKIEPRHIFWWNQKATDRQNFLELQHPGGGTHSRRLFSERYALYGIPEAFESGLITPIAEKAEVVQDVNGRGIRVTWTDVDGHKVSKRVDYLFVATGLDSPSLGILRKSFELDPSANPKQFLSPVYAEPGQAVKRVVAARFNPDNTDEDTGIYLVGPGIGLSVDPDSVETSITGSPDSINVIGSLSAAFGLLSSRLFTF